MRIKWTEEKISEEAKKYSKRVDFQKNSPNAYIAALNRKLLDKVCSHMPKLKNHNWTYDELKKIADRYDVYREFVKKENACYLYASRHGFIESITSHMKKRQKWDVEKIKIEALKYQSKSEFESNSPSAWGAAKRLGIYNEVTQHMILLGNHKKRMVYCVEFSDNHFYVGLTFNKFKRFHAHTTQENSSVFRHIKKTGLTPNFKELTDYINKDLATEKENYFLNEYISKGWIPLNIAKTGGLGGNLKKWSKEKVFEIAKKYKTLSDFRKYDSKAYHVSINHGWYDEITEILQKHYKFNKYDEEIVKNLIKNYKNLADFRKFEAGAYNFILKHKLKDLLKDLKRGDILKYNLENVKNEAKKYKTKKEFMENSRGFYNAALYNGWIGEVTEHMMSRFIWTKDLVSEITKKYDNYTEFIKKHKSAYDAAVKYGWIEELTHHMKKRKVWDYESVKKEALKFKNRDAFRMGSLGGYSYAKKNNILDEITSHMELRNVKGYKKNVFICEFCGKKIGGHGNIKRHIKVNHSI